LGFGVGKTKRPHTGEKKGLKGENLNTPPKKKIKKNKKKTLNPQKKNLIKKGVKRGAKKFQKGEKPPLKDFGEKMPKKTRAK